MRRSRLSPFLSLTRHRLLLAILFLSLLLLLQLPFLSRRLSPSLSAGDAAGLHTRRLDSAEDTLLKTAPARPSKNLSRSPTIVSKLLFQPRNSTTVLDRSAKHAWDLGTKLLDELRSASPPKIMSLPTAKASACPHSIKLRGDEFERRHRLMLIPCGLALGSHITVIGKPRRAHLDHDPKISMLRRGEEAVMVSQFVLELQGLTSVDGEAPPRILHFNPRLKGDWSRRPVIEQNTCYRMQWGVAQRCGGSPSPPVDETVDGQVKCEGWVEGGDKKSGNLKESLSLNRLIGLSKKKPLELPFPFVEEQLFVLTLSAGLEGYHVSVDGRHVTSLPYHPGFVLGDATGLALNGDIEVESIYAASLPSSHSGLSQQRSLEMSPEWQAPPVPDKPVDIFIGILSTGNHFMERMAARKSWMTSVRGSANVVARFFVALHGRKEVNVELKKEAEFFGDIVIVPYMDSYDLVVLKTVAICEYGVRALSAKHIMKCDDDTFVRVAPLVAELKQVPSNVSLYVGNMNYFHRPLRSGKWAVTYEEWPEEVYPPYANGPGYIVSSDIARLVLSEFEKHTIRLFKMEDVSMGMWVGQFNESRPVEYIHSSRFCQFGCIYDYYTAHYQSPRQMMCLWNKLQAGKPQCCNMG